MTIAAVPVPVAEDQISRDERDIRRGSTLTIIGFACRLGARIPFLLIAGRLYGTETYGVYVLATAVVETLALLSSFGLKRTIFHVLDTEDRDAAFVIRHAVLVSLTLSLLLVVVLQISAGALAAVFALPQAADAVSLLAWAIPCISLTDVFLSATLSRRVLRFEVAVRSFVEPLTLTVMSFVFFYGGLRDTGLMGAFLCAFGLACGVSAVQCGRMFGASVFAGGVDIALITRILRGSASTCLHDLSRVLIMRLDTFAVGYFFSSSAVGLYGMAQQFLTIVEKIALSFYPMLMPVVMSAVSNRDRTRLIRQLRSAVGRMVLLQAPVVVTFFFFGRDLLALIGPDFAAAWPVLMILTLGCWINAAIQLLEIPLTYIRPRANLIACLAAIAAYLIAVTPLQGLWGTAGIAVTSVSSVLLSNLVLIVYFSGVLNFNHLSARNFTHLSARNFTTKRQV